jgi:2',3'-cyclic-nucleotide 2'-phosphodiesterase (5'-nucleotidase family)
MYSRDRIRLGEWRAIASAAPDICVMLDYEIEAPAVVRRDGIIVKTVSGYNQSKEIDILDLQLSGAPLKIVGFAGRRIAVDHQEIQPDQQVAAVAEIMTRQTRDIKDTLIGSFAGDYQRSYNSECPIGNMIADAMLAESGCDLALHNSGGIQNNIQAGDFTLGDLFSMMPFDNQLVQMELTGQELADILALSASLQRGLLQIAGGSYSFVNNSGNDYAVKSILIGGQPLEPQRSYSVCTNSFLAEGGDNFSGFASGRKLQFGRQQRDVVREYIIRCCASAPMSLATDGRIVRE